MSELTIQLVVHLVYSNWQSKEYTETNISLSYYIVLPIHREILKQVRGVCIVVSHFSIYYNMHPATRLITTHQCA